MEKEQDIAKAELGESRQGAKKANAKAKVSKSVTTS